MCRACVCVFVSPYLRMATPGVAFSSSLKMIKNWSRGTCFSQFSKCTEYKPRKNHSCVCANIGTHKKSAEGVANKQVAPLPGWHPRLQGSTLASATS